MMPCQIDDLAPLMGGGYWRQVSRRTWDTEEYQKRADERREEEERLEREVCAFTFSPSPASCPLIPTRQ